MRASLKNGLYKNCGASVDEPYKAFERNRALILASERWADEYSKTPEIHAKLIKSEARFERKTRTMFKELSLRAKELVNWTEYYRALQAYNIDVIINDDLLEETADDFVKIAFEELVISTALGAQSGEQLYRKALGLTSSDSVIQNIALNHAARLVGNIINRDGKIVPNPKSELNIFETTRADIRQSLSTSLNLGDDISEATERIAGVINNPRRAELIARTETVNSFGEGLLEFGKQSEAVGKQWQDTGATDDCADNTDQGPIPFDDSFQSGDDAPAAHPNCRCSMRLIYQNELDNNPNLFD